jgi:hypothetical protein
MADCDPILHLISDYARGVEVGVSKGESSLAFLEQRSCSMILVDPWCKVEGYDEYLGSDETLAACLERLKSYTWRKNCQILRMTSEQLAKAFVVPQEFDFVFIDANHKYEFVSQDMRLWWPHVKEGGYLFGHDYDLPNHEWGVKRAVNEFALEKGLDVGVYPPKNPQNFACWSIKKPAKQGEKQG